jgi:ABC-type bacteriocin/lantibiotic exporter with double-glycine peptidase domain
MTFCHQKYKHCFVACCASALNQSSISEQEAIVARFPVELQKGTVDEGVPKTSREVFSVVIGLNLSANPGIIVSTEATFRSITEFLKAHRQHGERMMILTKHPTNHCIRVKEINDDRISVMDPEANDFTQMTWQEFEAKQPAILLL